MLGGPLIIVLIISFDLLIKSVKRLGVGTVYAVFTEIGVVGIVFLPVLFIICLRLASDEQEEKI